MRWVRPLVLVIALPGAALAQTDTVPADGWSVVGTALAGFGTGSPVGSPDGYGFSLEVPLPKTVAIKFEYFNRDSGRVTSCSQGSISYSCAVKETVRLAGLGFNGPEFGRISPFAEAMMGQYSIGAFSRAFPVLAVGAGADLRLGSVFTYRVGVRHTRSVAGGDHPGFADGPLRHTSVLAGIRFSFGKAP